MKKSALVVVIAAAALFCFSQTLLSEDKKPATGEELFNKLCSACHPNGGNVFKANKTLSKADMQANNVKTAADIVNLMRNPGPFMAKFDKETISDKDAMMIAEFVLQKYNK
ncbi:MAG: c-type cytochrome [Nitrospiraceae bacterium]|nr:c-type cytochrome [Nitrospiraceae bacterium]